MRGDRENYPYPLISLILALLLVLVAINLAMASEDDDCRDAHSQCGHDDNGGLENVEVQSEATAESSAISESAATANAAGGTGGEGGSATAQGGGDASIVFGKRAPSTYLYMQNQVESCGRTFGFSGSNTSGSWTFGLPIPRSWTPTCDLWKAAEEAQQNGFVYLSYTFQCSIKAVRKVLGDDKCENFEERVLVELGFVDEAPDLGSLYNRNVQVGWLLADVTEEEYIAQQAAIEYRLEQTEAVLAEREQLIEEHKKETEKHDAELERFRQQVAAAGERHVKESARRAAARAALAEKENQQ